jgi:diguanylate cyclase (GGDEF)-like protein
MFQLTRVYSIASFLGIVLVAVALSMLYRTTSVRALIEHETRSNESITQTLSNALWPQYAEFVARTESIPVQALAAQPEIKRLHADVLQKLHGTRVARVKIYNRAGITVYSADLRQIGEAHDSAEGFSKAITGESFSKIIFVDQLSAADKKSEDRDLITTYIPARATPSGPVEGVFEVYSDVTGLVHDVRRTEYTVIAIVMASLLLLYFFLLIIVRRADRIIQAHDHEEREAQAEQINYMAYHDPLTGLPNRALFKDRFQHAVMVALRAHASLGIMSIDIDRFKIINDSLGHEGGDAVLIEAAKRIRACLRASDAACRIGGNEFSVVLENLASKEDAAEAAARLIQKFSEPLKIGDREVMITASIGIAIFPGATEDVQRLLKNANAAMHEAKETGRNRYVFYTQEMNARAQESHEYEMGLHKALQNQEFRVYYQPRVNTATGKLVGAEALLRWQHPNRGLVVPDNFIPLLEDTGLIIPVGEWVLQQACQECRRWHAAGYGAMGISVNISAKQFRSGTLLASVRRALEASQLPPHFLELELTESVLVDGVEQALDLMRELKELGISLSIDDFGTGYSSLNYLRRFPIDLLKIDRSFVHDVANNRGDAAITTTIAVMAKSLRLGILAEGVETRDQARFLRAIGCHEMQGYLFGRAIPAREFSEQLATLDVSLLAGMEPKPILAVPGSPAAA